MTESGFRFSICAKLPSPQDRTATASCRVEDSSRQRLHISRSMSMKASTLEENELRWIQVRPAVTDVWPGWVGLGAEGYLMENAQWSQWEWEVTCFWCPIWRMRVVALGIRSLFWWGWNLGFGPWPRDGARKSGRDQGTNDVIDKESSTPPFPNPRPSACSLSLLYRFYSPSIPVEYRSSLRPHRHHPRQFRIFPKKPRHSEASPLVNHPTHLARPTSNYHHNHRYHNNNNHHNGNIS